MNRRDFLLSTAAIIAGLSSNQAFGWRTGVPTTFGGGKSQFGVNLPGASGSGEIPFINLLKNGQGWVRISDTVAYDPADLDSNGYPTAINGGGPYALVYIPNTTQRPGNYVLRWSGNGTVTVFGNSFTYVSGSLTSTTGSGRYEFTPTGTPTVAGFPIAYSIGISAIGTPRISNMIFCHVDDEAKAVRGQIYTDNFLRTIRDSNFGVIRFLNWQGSNSIYTTDWNSRRRLDYAIWASPEQRNSIYAGPTSHSGDDYSITFGSGAPVDKQTIIVKFDADCSGLSPTLNLNTTGAKAILRANSNPNTVNSVPRQDKYATLVFDEDLDSWCKYGGDINDGSGFLNNGIPIEAMLELCIQTRTHPYFNAPMFAVDPMTDYFTGLCTYLKNNMPTWMIPRFEGCNECWNTRPPFYPTQYAWNKQLIRNGGSTVRNATNLTWTGSGSSGTSTITFGADHNFPLGARVIPSGFNGITSGGFFNDLAMYVSEVVSPTVIKVNSAPVGGSYTGGGTVIGTSDANTDWYGQTLSTMGQVIYPIFNNDPTKFELLCGVQTASTPSGNNPRLASYSYVFATGGPPASNYVTAIVAANYTAPTINYTNTVLSYGFEFFTGSNTNRAIEYVADIENPAETAATNAYVVAKFTGFQTWAAGFGISKVHAYEGGYSPDYAMEVCSSTISGATQANPCVLTLAASNIQGLVTVGNPAVVGMLISPASVGGMTQLNCPQQATVTFSAGTANVNWTGHGLVVGQGVAFDSYPASCNYPPEINDMNKSGNVYYVVATPNANTIQISLTDGGAAIVFSTAGSGTLRASAGWFVTAVNGNSVIIDCDASAFSAYTSTGTGTWLASAYYINNLRYNGKFASNLPAVTLALYEALEAIGVEFPSQYILGGQSRTSGNYLAGQVWGLYENLFEVPSTAQAGIQEFNA